MKIEIFAGEGGEFYIRPPGSSGALRWFCSEGSWFNAREQLPDGARKAEFGELPEALREEILAFAARAETMGNQGGGGENGRGSGSARVWRRWPLCSPCCP